eukprot:Skav218144  [mRNA]  locus=scaffold759:551626:553927:+ [translate_table: standard]
MTRRVVLPAFLATGAVLACVHGICQAFVAPPGGHSVMAVRPASTKSAEQNDLVGITCGMVGRPRNVTVGSQLLWSSKVTSVAVVAVASRARVVARANPGSPSLIQVGAAVGPGGTWSSSHVAHRRHGAPCCAAGLGAEETSLDLGEHLGAAEI